TDLALDRQTLLLKRTSGQVVALQRGKVTSTVESQGPGSSHLRRIRKSQCDAKPVPALCKEAAHVPKSPEPTAQAQGQIRVLDIDRPSQCRTEVVVLSSQAAQPDALAWASQVGRSLLGQPHRPARLLATQCSGP